jgi:glycosyltransferase involved in cell wall biosynthesis
MSSISVLILTRNEEQNISACLESVSWSDDVHVIDSLSTDKTTDIVRASGATVWSRPFDNWSSHQNWALSNIPFQHSWVFYLDADERCTPPLMAGMLRAIQQGGDAVAFQVQRRDFFRNRWLKHVQATSHYTRLFQPSYIKYERLVNPVTVIDGASYIIKGAYLDHFPFSKGLAHWFERHNAYSTLEAQTERQNLSFTRKGMKELYYRLPCRPIVCFIWLYLVKRGFMDGSPGLHYSLMRTYYEYMIVLKEGEASHAHTSVNL